MTSRSDDADIYERRGERRSDRAPPTPRKRRLSAYALLTSLVSAFAGQVPAQADEPLFGFMYTTDLLPQGKWEVEQWLTGRFQKAHGDFYLWQGRTELEYGIADNFQLSFYANYAWTHAFRQNVDYTTSPPETFAGPVIDPNNPFNGHKFTGGSVEAIYRVLSPYTDPVGMALYFEPTWGKGVRMFESRLILQKNFLDDLLVFAFNMTVEQELRFLDGDPAADPTTIDYQNHWDRETDVNFGLGVSYRFAPNWSIGAEFQHEREFSSFQFWNSNFATNSAFYAGPNIHYGGEHFFMTVTALGQLPGARDFTHSDVIYNGRNYADDFEKFRLRIKAGWYF